MSNARFYDSELSSIRGHQNLQIAPKLLFPIGDGEVGRLQFAEGEGAEMRARGYRAFGVGVVLLGRHGHNLVGVAVFFIAIIGLIFIVVRAAIFGDPVAGWPSMMAVILFVGGLQLVCLGIIGQYLAKTYVETKRRPIYLVKETNIKH